MTLTGISFTKTTLKNGQTYFVLNLMDSDPEFGRDQFSDNVSYEKVYEEEFPDTLKFVKQLSENEILEVVLNGRE